MIASSSTHAEIQAASRLAKDTLWLRTFLNEIKQTQRGSTVMYQDNDPAICQAKDLRGTKMSKSYLVLLRKIQELIHVGEVHMNPIDTRENVADMFTKALNAAQFWYLSSQAVGDHRDETYGHIYRDHARSFTQLYGGSVPTTAKINLMSSSRAMLECAKYDASLGKSPCEFYIEERSGTHARYSSISQFYVTMERLRMQLNRYGGRPVGSFRGT